MRGEISYQCHAGMYRQPNGKDVYIMSDDPEPKPLEQIISREGTLFRLLMDNVPEYVFIKDRNLRFIQTNKAHSAILGLSDPRDVVGKSDADFRSGSETLIS